MFRDIVVNLNLHNGKKFTEDYAVSLAGTFNAHITGIAIAIVPHVPGASLGYLPIETIEAQQRANEEAAEKAIDVFNAATASAGVTGAPYVLRSGSDTAAEQFSHIVRRFDLSIFGQSEPETAGLDTTIAEATLFGSGRPIIIVPYIQKTPLKLDRVMICWDSSRAATRAIADAMPLLERAGEVELVTIATERGKQIEITGIDMGHHLARHGLKVQVHRIVRGEAEVVDALLSHAADSGSDFLVMGGYGHSRLREFLLGGVTRSILRTMTIPTLMSH